jgi:hypothetical protein
MKASLDGGGPTTLASGVFTPWSLAVDSERMYWPNIDRVMSMPLDGGSPTILATGQSNAQLLVVDATSLYWTDSVAGTVMKLTPK